MCAIANNIEREVRCQLMDTLAFDIGATALSEDRLMLALLLVYKCYGKKSFTLMCENRSILILYFCIVNMRRRGGFSFV